VHAVPSLIAEKLHEQEDRGGLGAMGRPGVAVPPVLAGYGEPVPLAGQRAVPYLARARQQGS
jgi:hypothetical protein